MMPLRLRSAIAAFPAIVISGCSPTVSSMSPDQLEQRARGIHERVLTLDTHVDINAGNFTAERNYTQRLTTQVDLPKMEEGGLDAAFLIVYVGQRADLTEEGFARAHEQAIEKFDAIHRLTKEIAPDRIGLALTAEEARQIHRSGRKVALIGVENGFPIGNDITNVRRFHERGARYMSLAHNGHSQLSDSNTGENPTVGWLHGGLSPLGREVIAEMNRWGIMIDISHPSKQSMMQTLEITQAPIIASHSAARALCNHSRNLDDEQLHAIARNNGVVQVVAFRSYLKCEPSSPERLRLIGELREEFDLAVTGGRGAGAVLAAMPEPRRLEYQRRLAVIDSLHPAPSPANVADFVDHIDYVVKLVGIDHVGISSDFDGGGGIVGWSDASETFNVTLELVRRGYTEQDIAKIWSGNLLRAMEDVRRVAERIQQSAGQSGEQTP